MASNNTRQPSQRRRPNRKQQGTMPWGPSPNTNHQGTMSWGPSPNTNHQGTMSWGHSPNTNHQGTVSWGSSPNTNINKDKRAHTIKCLTDVFQENFDTKVIQSVAESCNFDKQSAAEALMLMSADNEMRKNAGQFSARSSNWNTNVRELPTRPPVWNRNALPREINVPELPVQAKPRQGRVPAKRETHTPSKAPSPGWGPIKVSYRSPNNFEESDSDADVVVEEEKEFEISSGNQVFPMANIPCQIPPQFVTPMVPLPEYSQTKSPSRPRPSMKAAMTKLPTIKLPSQAASFNPNTLPSSQMQQMPSKVPTTERIQRYIEMGTKIMVLMRGAPGSGKSFLAKQIVERTMGKNADCRKYLFSTDDYFVMIGNFVPNKLSDAHDWNKNRVFVAVESKSSPIIVDNTNTEIWEMGPYAVLAVKHGYILELLEPSTPWRYEESVLVQKNVHGVPQPKIRNMLSRFEKNLTAAKLLNVLGLKYSPANKPPQPAANLFKQGKMMAKQTRPNVAAAGAVAAGTAVPSKEKRTRTRHRSKRNSQVNAGAVQLTGENITGNDDTKKMMDKLGEFLSKNYVNENKGLDSSILNSFLSRFSKEEKQTIPPLLEKLGTWEKEESSVPEEGTIESPLNQDIVSSAGEDDVDDETGDDDEDEMSGLFFSEEEWEYQSDESEETDIRNSEGTKLTEEKEQCLEYILVTENSEWIYQKDHSQENQNNSEDLIDWLSEADISEHNPPVATAEERENLSIMDNEEIDVEATSALQFSGVQIGTFRTNDLEDMTKSDNHPRITESRWSGQDIKPPTHVTDGKPLSLSSFELNPWLSYLQPGSEEKQELASFTCSQFGPQIKDSFIPGIEVSDKVNDEVSKPTETVAESAARLDEYETKHNLQYLNSPFQNETKSDLISELQRHSPPSAMMPDRNPDYEKIPSIPTQDSDCSEIMTIEKPGLKSFETPGISAKDDTQMEITTDDVLVLELEKKTVSELVSQEGQVRETEKHSLESDMVPRLETETSVNTSKIDCAQTGKHEVTSVPQLIGEMSGDLEHCIPARSESQQNAEMHESISTEIVPEIARMNLQEQETNIPRQQATDDDEVSRNRHEKKQYLENVSITTLTKSLPGSGVLSWLMKCNDDKALWEHGDSSELLEKSDSLSDPRPARDQRSFRRNVRPIRLTAEKEKGKLIPISPECIDWTTVAEPYYTWETTKSISDDSSKNLNGPQPQRSLFASEIQERDLSTRIEKASNTHHEDFVMLSELNKNLTPENLTDVKILPARSVSINYGLTPLNSTKQHLPMKLMLDKSSMTDEDDDIALALIASEREDNATKKKYFEQLATMFPHVPHDDLMDIFEKCQYNLSWTVDLLLESKLEKFEPLSTAKDENACLESNQNIQDENACLENDQKTKLDAPTQEKNPKSKPEVDEMALKLWQEEVKQYIEECVVLGDDNYSEHTLQIKKLRHGQNADMDKINMAGAQSLPDNSQAMLETMWEQQWGERAQIGAEETESTSSGSYENDDKVPCNLGNTFINQMLQMFDGAISMHPEDIPPVVVLPVSLLSQIYHYVVVSQIHYLKQKKLDEQTKEDEEIARKLQEEEDNAASTANVTPNLHTLMDMEYALQLCRHDPEAAIPNDLATTINKNTLLKLFPHIDKKAILSTFAECNCNFHDTFQVLCAEEEDSEKVKNVYAPEAFRKLQEDVEKTKENQGRTSKGAAALNDNDYLSDSKEIENVKERADRFRNNSIILLENYRKKKQEVHMAFKTNQIPLAKIYNELAKMLQKKFDDTKARAAACYLMASELNGEKNTLDLHCLHVDEALAALDLFLDKHIAEMNDSEFHRTLYIITGRGLHSRNGIPRVRPAVEERLKQRHLRWSANNPGSLCVVVKGLSHLSCNVK